MRISSLHQIYRQRGNEHIANLENRILQYQKTLNDTVSDTVNDTVNDTVKKDSTTSQLI